MFHHYFDIYHYFYIFKTLFFTFSPRRGQRRRQQYDVFQKMFYETSFSIANIYSFITSFRNNRVFQLIDSQHSTFTFCHIFISFWSRWRYLSHIWNQHLSKTWEIVDKWRFWLMIRSSKFLLEKLIDWWSIDDQKVSRKRNSKEIDERW